MLDKAPARSCGVGFVTFVARCAATNVFVARCAATNVMACYEWPRAR
jgi:hypothetical protein